MPIPTAVAPIGVGQRVAAASIIPHAGHPFKGIVHVAHAVAVAVGQRRERAEKGGAGNKSLPRVLLSSLSYYRLSDLLSLWGTEPSPVPQSLSQSSTRPIPY